VLVGDDAEPALPAAPQEPGTAAERHTCLVLQVQKDRSVKVDRLVEQDGLAVAGERLVGDWLYEVLDGERVLAVGSLQDPLVMTPVCTDRPADPRQRLRLPELQQARVVLTLDAALIDPVARAPPTIRFHELKDAAGLPVELTPATFAAFRAKAAPIATVTATDLVQARTERK
jgi:hypothetical protein